MKHTRRWNIAMLGHKTVPSRQGGVEVVVEELSIGMAKRGHLITCYNRSGRIKKKSSWPYDRVRLKKVFTIPFKGLAAASSSMAAAVCAALGKYDIVHFHAEGPCAMLWLPKLSGKKCVATIHGLDWQRSKWGKLASLYLKFGEKMAVKYADEIIVLSHAVQQYFLENYNRETVYIPNGIRSMPIRPADIICKRWGLNKGEYILYLGRIVPEKGIQYLIDAFKELDTDKKLVIAGGASDTGIFFESLKKECEMNSNIIFTGHVQGRTLEELYSNAYVYCLPSDVEGMPLTLLEAMSYGLCCVTSDIPECTEVTEILGYSFKKGNVAQLRKILQVLVDCPNFTIDKRDEIIDKIEKNYSWDKTVEQTLKVYEKVMDKRENFDGE